MLKLPDVICDMIEMTYLCKQKDMVKRLFIFICFATIALCAFASRIPVYLCRCPSGDDTYGNITKRTPAQPLCIWQEQNNIYVPQGESIYCMLSDADGIVYECTVPANGVVVLPSDLHGQFELLIQMNDVSYKDEISL